MFKKFEEFNKVNENHGLFQREHTEAYLRSAIYEIAKRSGFHLQYFNTDNEIVNIMVPVGQYNTDHVVNKVSNILDEAGIEHEKPKQDGDKPVKGSDQFMKANFDDVYDFGKKIYPKTDSK